MTMFMHMDICNEKERKRKPKIDKMRETERSAGVRAGGRRRLGDSETLGKESVCAPDKGRYSHHNGSYSASLHRKCLEARATWPPACLS